MILSMTGFGKATLVVSNKKITAEIKTLNSKQMDLSVKVPLLYRELELELRNTIANELGRGKVDVYITSESIDSAGASQLNVEMLRSYKSQVENVSRQLGLPEPTDWYSTLLRMPDVYKQDLNEEVAQEELDGVREVVRQALQATTDFRKQEGAKLYHFFKEKIAAIQQLLNSIVQYEPTRTEKIKARLIEQLGQLGQVDYDKNRLEQELIFYIEKLDITEEKIRLQNHLNYFLETLDGPERQGKKLGFISQEMGREINTTGSKSNHAEMQKIVVEMKDNLEQIKEQVLNVL
ncbi:MAG: YicC family protein [Muribaculaceae bacterium]|nr:YicC family protein [Muribaculaceae bacterium]